MEDNIKSQLELEKLAENLRKLDKPKFSEARKSLLKSRILEKTNADVTDYVSAGLFAFNLDFVTKARIKEKLMALIDERVQRKFVWQNLFAFHKKAVSMALVFVMMFSFVSYLNIDVNVVSAATFTTFDQLEGDVQIERDGEFIEAEVGMELYERDKILTGDNSGATIHFFDDSISRLAQETQIVINKLFRPKDSSVKSYVELSIDEGVVWSRVLNLVEDHSSFVVEAMDFYLSAQRAAFNVSVVDDKFGVDVYSHIVEVRGGGDVNRIVTGQSASLNSSRQLVVNNNGGGDANWIAANLHSDQEYILTVEKKLLVAQAESAGKEITDERSLKDSAMLILTFDDVKQVKLKLELAEEDFMLAVATLNQRFLKKSERDSANAAIVRFENEVLEFYNFVEKIRFTDSKYADELKRYVTDKVLAQKKNFSLVRANSPLYAAKEVIAKLELLNVSGNDAKIAKVKREQALEKLSEAEDAKVRGDDLLAKKAIDDYKNEMVEVEVIVDALDGDQSADLKRDFASKIENDKMLLNKLESNEKVGPSSKQVEVSTVKIVDPVVEQVVEEVPLPPEFIID